LVPESDQPTRCGHNGGHLIWRDARDFRVLQTEQG
jgi:hypothetical protein